METPSFEAPSIKPLTHGKVSANMHTFSSDAGRRKTVSASGLEGQIHGLGRHIYPWRCSQDLPKEDSGSKHHVEHTLSGQRWVVNSSFLILYLFPHLW